MKELKQVLSAFKRLLGSLSRRVKRVEDNQILAYKEMHAKLDLVLANQDAMIKLFSPKVVRELELLPETAEMVRTHDEWQRREDERRRVASAH